MSAAMANASAELPPAFAHPRNPALTTGTKDYFGWPRRRYGTGNGRNIEVGEYVPIAQWLPDYQRSWLTADAIAAATVWALLVPEAMAYASPAGMPPETVLWAAPLALLGYAIFGTSRQLNVGPAGLGRAVILSLFFLVGSRGIRGRRSLMTASEPDADDKGFSEYVPWIKLITDYNKSWWRPGCGPTCTRRWSSAGSPSSSDRGSFTSKSTTASMSSFPRRTTVM
jgi:hypothetical protein